MYETKGISSRVRGTHVRILCILLCLAPLACRASAGPDLSLVEKIQAVNEENNLLRLRIEELEARLAGMPQRPKADLPICIVRPPIVAAVLEADDEARLVVLDKGLQDGVKIGYVFDIYLNSTYKGQVYIYNANETLSFGRIVIERICIAKGDLATTAL